MAWIGGNRYLNQSQMENNATIIWNNLGSRGWSIFAVAGMLGNIQSESTVNPNVWESLTVDYERGYGLTQWTPATKYIDWAGVDWESGDKQLDRIDWEKETGNQWFKNPSAPIVDPPISFKEFSVSQLPPATLANYFLWYYEHPADINQPNRATQAEAWYTFLTGLPPPRPSSPGTAMPIWFYLKKF